MSDDESRKKREQRDDARRDAEAIQARVVWLTKELESIARMIKRIEAMMAYAPLSATSDQYLHLRRLKTKQRDLDTEMDKLDEKLLRLPNLAVIEALNLDFEMYMRHEFPAMTGRSRVEKISHHLVNNVYYYLRPLPAQPLHIPLGKHHPKLELTLLTHNPKGEVKLLNFGTLDGWRVRAGFAEDIDTLFHTTMWKDG